MCSRWDRIEAVVLGVNKDEQKLRLGSVSSSPIRGTNEVRYDREAGHGHGRNMTAYGAFVELEEGIDGMIHVSDLHEPVRSIIERC
jgi:small subunit ribosomal protein S1